MMDSFTITQATDWPMLRWNLTILAGVFGFLWAIIIVLIRSYHGAVLQRIDERFDAAEKAEKEHCGDCQKSITARFKHVWRHMKTEGAA